MQLSDKDILQIILTENSSEAEPLFAQARKVCEERYGKNVYIRGLIEFTNYCKNDCYYCGLRCSNKNLKRYRLSPDEILVCCRTASELGIKTFVLQGGEDSWFSGERVAQIISEIRQEFPEHAITLSIGERSKNDYELFFRAGANRYLLRHETACKEHYAKLHPSSMTLAARKQCLWELKKTGYQTGAGSMTGTPWQTPECLLADLRFLQELQPQMIGIGPFIPQKDTPFGTQQPGCLFLSLKMIALTRLLLPEALIPATTAMETISPCGRELALNAGANIVMANISPAAAKKHYTIYDNKVTGADRADENIFRLKEKITSAGYVPDMSRGDAVNFFLENNKRL